MTYVKDLTKPTAEEMRTERTDRIAKEQRDLARARSRVHPQTEHRRRPTAADSPVTDKRKQSLYFTEDMLTQIVGEARRLDRSLSWVVQRAWVIARDKIGDYPSPPAEGGG